MQIKSFILTIAAGVVLLAGGTAGTIGMAGMADMAGGAGYQSVAADDNPGPVVVDPLG